MGLTGFAALYSYRILIMRYKAVYHLHTVKNQLNELRDSKEKLTSENKLRV